MRGGTVRSVVASQAGGRAAMRRAGETHAPDEFIWPRSPAQATSQKPTIRGQGPCRHRRRGLIGVEAELFRDTHMIDPLHARALVLDDGSTRLAICVVDTLLMPRELVDRAKRMASEATGIPTDHMLVSATHTHSAPSVMEALGTGVDEPYAALLPGRIAEAIEAAATNVQLRTGQRGRGVHPAARAALSGRVHHVARPIGGAGGRGRAQDRGGAARVVGGGVRQAAPQAGRPAGAVREGGARVEAPGLLAAERVGRPEGGRRLGPGQPRPIRAGSGLPPGRAAVARVGRSGARVAGAPPHPPSPGGA